MVYVSYQFGNLSWFWVECFETVSKYVSIWLVQIKECLKNIKILNDCEVQIEFRHDRDVRHHEAFRVMPNSYPERRNFQFAPSNHYGFFFLWVHFHRQLHFSLDMCYFINLTLKYLHLRPRTVGFGSYQRIDLRLAIDPLPPQGEFCTLWFLETAIYKPQNETC